jgi:DNA-binding XRE family transcriptional regulator
MENLFYKTETEWLTANPLYKWRNDTAQSLPNPVDASTEKPAVPQQDVADKIGVTRMAISQWENGQFMPKFEYFIKLAPLMCYSSDVDLYKYWVAWRNAKPAIEAQLETV